MSRIEKVLIANRGEIAGRIAGTLLEKGILPVIPVVEKEFNQVVSVFSGAELILSEDGVFLNPDDVIRIAQETGCQAVHPGYGFMAENSGFAKLCRQNNLIFIGPSPEAIDLMGDKQAARKVAEEAGVSPVPGFNIDGLSEEDIILKAEAAEFPVLVKASMGGGGKGMRKVDSSDQLVDGIRMARSEALKYFNSDSVFVEKYIESPRHIEIQIFSFEPGNTVYVGERECTIQRRHQKIIEETPSVFVDEEMRRKMGEAAVRLANTVGYTGAGTVEFIVDESKGFYFLEMNTRIQVEHPISEESYGVDLVKWQIEQVMGDYISRTQDSLVPNRYSLELRIYAEDPDNNFMPSPGKVLLFKAPEGPGIRVESTVSSGYEIFPDFDPMIAKVVVNGEDRKRGIEKAIKALNDFAILGVKTNREYLIRILKHEAFLNGEFDTHFTEIFKDSLMDETAKMTPEVAAAASYVIRRKVCRQISEGSGSDYYPEISTRIP